jgi:RNA polymerase sigma factor (sigma-70 family)
MANGPLSALIRDLRRVFLVRDTVNMTDGQLLEWFLADRDEAAFEALVRRHGPMVLGVCRRVLRHAHDAEDAFQATFLVLMRKASSIVKRDMLGAWLYGVAYRIAVRAKAMTARRRIKEMQVSERLRPQAPEENHRHDWEPLLDREVSRLPEKYRVPLVLCELEGKSRKEVAGHLGLPEGTLSSRLSRARDLLRKRLTRQGVTLGAAALAAALTQQAAAAYVPTPLVAATVKTAMAFGAGTVTAAGVASGKVLVLANGAIKAMLLTKLKVSLMLLLAVGFLSAGIGVRTYQTLVGQAAHRLPERKQAESAVARAGNRSGPEQLPDSAPAESARFGLPMDMAPEEGQEPEGGILPEAELADPPPGVITKAARDQAQPALPRRVESVEGKKTLRNKDGHPWPTRLRGCRLVPCEALPHPNSAFRGPGLGAALPECTPPSTSEE